MAAETLAIVATALKKVYPPNQQINDDDMFLPNVYNPLAYTTCLATILVFDQMFSTGCH